MPPKVVKNTTVASPCASTFMFGLNTANINMDMSRVKAYSLVCFVKNIFLLSLLLA